MASLQPPDQRRVSRSRGGDGRFGIVTQTATALAALGALVFTGLSLTVTRDQNEAQNNLTAQSQYTDRYTKAVEQLGQHGADRLQIRLGGIYALERLARDSPRDQPTIIEVLSAFIRTNNPRTTNDERPDFIPPSADTQAALTVLIRRDTEHDNSTRIDLRDSHLASADLHYANLRNTILTGANLARANLRGADLRGVDLIGAELAGAGLTGTDLRGAKLGLANLGFTNLDSANLVTADLSHASLQSANLGVANLSFASLHRANLSRAHLQGAYLYKADLDSANLGGANLIDTNLSAANLSAANLVGAKHNAGTRIDQVRVDSATRWW